MLSIHICIFSNVNICTPDTGQGGPLQVFKTGGRGMSLHAVPAGLRVPYHTHCRILCLTPWALHAAEHYKC